MFIYYLKNLILTELRQFRHLSKRNLFDLNFKLSKSKNNQFNKLVLDKRRLYCTDKSDEKIKVNYILKDGKKVTVEGSVGQNVMEVAQDNDIDIEGACAASLACCTCHVYVKQEYFDKLSEICDLEEDMLDQAPFLKENSRLSCQIILSKELDNIEVQLPPCTRNFYIDGHKLKLIKFQPFLKRIIL